MKTLEERIKRVLQEGISIVPYNPAWPRMFEEEKMHLPAGSVWQYCHTEPAGKTNHRYLGGSGITGRNKKENRSRAGSAGIRLFLAANAR